MDNVNGLLLLLEEESLRRQALEGIYKVVDTNWSEIVTSLEPITTIADESPDLSLKQLASAIVSRCLYHFESLDQSLLYALKAGEFLDLSKGDEYSMTISAKALQVYIQHVKQESSESIEETIFFGPGSPKEVIDRLENLIDDVFSRCIKEGDFKGALGIALESASVKKVLATLERSKDFLTEAVSYCIENVLAHRITSSFRNEVLEAILDVLDINITEENYWQIFVVLVTLGDVTRLAKLFTDLVQSEDMRRHLIAFQVAFDLERLKCTSLLRNLISALTKATNIQKEKVILQILSGSLPRQIYFEFLKNKSHSDISVFRKIKGTVSQKFTPSFLRTASLISYGFMQAGTGNSSFLDRSEGSAFVKPSSNWARFSCTSVYGVIHRNNLQDPNILNVFLPKDDLSKSSGGVFSDGGGLYAKGLLNSGTGNSTELRYLSDFIQKSRDKKAAGAKKEEWEPLLTGACYGIGLIGMGLGEEVESQSLWSALKDNDAVGSEAAAIGIGCLHLGRGKSEITSALYDMFSSTDHERVIRASGLAIALSVCELQDKHARLQIEKLISHQDSIVRYTGMFAIGLSAIATSSPLEIRRLLRIAVSDVSDDVRRAAVINLGFVCLDQPERVPQLISLLAESFNPHVRYGSALALGIASTNILPERNGAGQAILLRLTDDKVDYVRQGALIGMALGLSGYNWECEGPAKKCYDKFNEILETPKTNPVVKMGAILGMGILEQGGRNSRVEFLVNFGPKLKKVKSSAAAGMVLFLQYWYWYPFMHMASLCFATSGAIGVSLSSNYDKISVPQIVLAHSSKSNEDNAIFDYPAKIKNKKQTQKVLIQTAILSMSNKAKGSPEESQAESKNEEPKNAIEVIDNKENLLMNPLRMLPGFNSALLFQKNVLSPVMGNDNPRPGIIVLKNLDTEVHDQGIDLFLSIPLLQQETVAVQSDATTDNN